MVVVNDDYLSEQHCKLNLEKGVCIKLNDHQREDESPKKEDHVE